MDIIDILTQGVSLGASDLHLSSGQPAVLRIDGALQRLPGPPWVSSDLQQALLSVMAVRERQAMTEGRELDFAIEVPGLARFRVNVFWQRLGVAAVFRSIPSQLRSLEELALGPVFRRLSRLTRGLVLVTGPTGSGKSTTLAAMIDDINRHQAAHILTIEDPIEFIHYSQQALVSQREVGRDSGSFDLALRAALREDPDVILLGELRDLETIRLALTAAETGHVVFATLHTSSAAKTVDRIVDVFPAAEKNTVRSLLSESLEAVIAQRLLPASGGGRVAAHEILLATPAVRHLIREDKVAQMATVMQTNAQLGMQTLAQAVQALLAAGRITAETASAVTGGAVGLAGGPEREAVASRLL